MRENGISHLFRARQIGKVPVADQDDIFDRLTEAPKDGVDIKSIGLLGVPATWYQRPEQARVDSASCEVEDGGGWP